MVPCIGTALRTTRGPVFPPTLLCAVLTSVVAIDWLAGLQPASSAHMMAHVPNQTQTVPEVSLLHELPNIIRAADDVLLPQDGRPSLDYLADLHFMSPVPTTLDGAPCQSPISSKLSFGWHSPHPTSHLYSQFPAPPTWCRALIQPCGPLVGGVSPRLYLALTGPALWLSPSVPSRGRWVTVPPPPRQGRAGVRAMLCPTWSVMAE